MTRLLLLAVALAGCAGADEPVVPPETVWEAPPAPTDPATSLSAGVGDTVTVVVESNPSTGYAWHLLSEPEGAVVRLVGQAYRSDAPPDSRLVGGGGVDLWAFEAVGPGEAEVVLGQFPPGRQPPAVPFATRTYAVVVE